jgi:hypothetical protein
MTPVPPALPSWGGVDDVGRVLTAFNYRSATLSRYFAEESDAIAWLTEDIHPG